jgi:putative transcriptional regulator
MRNLRPEEKPRKNLAGSLLVAHPSMLDPNFRRAVLFISAHDPDDGAIGVIINRPLDKNVGDLVSETPPENLVDVPVFFGGPVGNNQLMLAAFEWQKGEGLKLNQQSLAANGAGVDQTDGGKSIRAFLGYAGWSAGQLEAEMKQKAWIVQKPSRAALKFERLSRLWFDIMNRLGPWYKMLAAAPDDPTLN